MQQRSESIAYDTTLIKEDMAAKGWLAVDVARRTRLSHMTISRFLKGERRTARTAHAIATALGHSVRRYLIPSQRRGAAA